MVWHDMKFLWQNRERPRNLKRWLVVWAKRFLQGGLLLRIFWRKWHLTRKGAMVGRMSILAQTSILGPLTHLKVGEHCSLGQCFISVRAPVTVGNYVVINDAVSILSGSHHLHDRLWRAKSSPILIKDFAWVARGAIILPGVTVGVGAVVGAGAVVRENVPDYGIATGNPAILSTSERTRDLAYSPVLFNAAYEAWLGNQYLEGLQGGL